MIVVINYSKFLRVITVHLIIYIYEIRNLNTYDPIVSIEYWKIERSWVQTVRSHVVYENKISNSNLESRLIESLDKKKEKGKGELKQLEKKEKKVIVITYPGNKNSIHFDVDWKKVRKKKKKKRKNYLS